MQAIFSITAWTFLARNIPLQKRAKHLRDFLENPSHVVMGQLFDMFRRIHDVEKQIDSALIRLRHPGPSRCFGPYAPFSWRKTTV